MKNFSVLAVASLISGSVFADVTQPFSASYLEPISGVVSPVNNLSLNEANGVIAQLQFNLPEDLVGQNVPPMVFNRVDGGSATHWQMSTADGAGTQIDCKLAPDDNSATGCTFKYAPGYGSSAQVGDLNSVQDFLKQKYASSPELLQTKLQAAISFHGDPEGVLSFSTP